MRYLSYEKADCNNGSGYRVVIWLSGCSWNCPFCFSPSTHNPKNGVLITDGFLDQVMIDLNKPYIEGITISGGDSFHKANYEGVLQLLKRIKKELPNKTVWAYTGYTIEELLADEERKKVLPYIDTLAEGRFIDELKDLTLPYTGSTNQRVINIKELT